MPRKGNERTANQKRKRRQCVNKGPSSQRVLSLETTAPSDCSTQARRMLHPVDNITATAAGAPAWETTTDQKKEEQA